MLLDAVTRGVGDQRAVAKRQRDRRRRNAERVRDRRELDFLRQNRLQTFKLFKE